MKAAIVVLLCIPAFVLLAACANGVSMSDEERIACRTDGCTVWTPGELQELANRAARAGYRQGWGDAVRQAGGGL